jgi:uncharacterized protein
MAWRAVARRPAAFVALAVTCSWLPWLVLLWTAGDPSAGSGAFALWALGGFGPAVAAFAVTAAGEGRDGVLALLRGLVRWRVGRWYALLLAPLPVAVVAVLAAVVAGPAALDLAGAAHWLLLPVLLASGVLFGGLEEVGWRGYLLPRLQAGRPALTASVLVGVVWSGWHLPLFAMAGTAQATASVAWFTLQAVGLSIVLTWAYNSTRGSVLLAVLAHGAYNAWFTAVVQGLAPATLATVTPFAAAVVLAAAVVVVWRRGPEHLARAPRQRWPGGDGGAGVRAPGRASP